VSQYGWRVPATCFRSRPDICCSQALNSVLLDPIDGLYTFNATAPLESGVGIRQVYLFGIYSHCGYINDKNGVCSNRTVASRFQPYDALTLDMRQNYTTITAAIILNTTFRESNYLGSSSKAAYYVLLLGTICVALALFTSAWPLFFMLDAFWNSLD
jgi:hypothetical protein